MASSDPHIQRSGIPAVIVEALDAILTNDLMIWAFHTLISYDSFPHGQIMYGHADPLTERRWEFCLGLIDLRSPDDISRSVTIYAMDEIVETRDKLAASISARLTGRDPMEQGSPPDLPTAYYTHPNRAKKYTTRDVLDWELSSLPRDPTDYDPRKKHWSPEQSRPNTPRKECACASQQK
jgi:hypothetical protein